MYFDYNENEDPIMSDINVTPLVDVMLVLLIIFMITMPVLFTRLDLDFPTTSDSKEIITNQEPNLLKITLDNNGTYYIEDKVASKDDLIDYINREKSKKNSVVALSAEKTTNFQQLLDLIKILQENGITKIGYMEEVH